MRGLFLVLVAVVIGCGLAYMVASIKEPQFPPGYYVNCWDSSCSVVFRDEHGSRSYVKERLTPTEAEELAKKLNETSDNKGAKK